MHTRLTELLDIEHPVMLAGMGGVSYAALVAAVSEAGGFGCLGASTMSPTPWSTEIAAVRGPPTSPSASTCSPPCRETWPRRSRGSSRAAPRCSWPGSASRSRWWSCATATALLVVNMCGKVDHARRAVDAGCDIVVAQGTEAGGHTGLVATLPLVPQIVDAVGDQVPVVAAGGIFDGRGLAAALALGADGVWVGTRFIATPEARAVPGYKDALLASREDRHHRQPGLLGQDDAGRGQRLHRLLRRPPRRAPSASPPSWRRSMATAPPPRRRRRHRRGRPRRECYPAGQGVGAITELVPAGELVRRFVAEAEEVLERLSAFK